MRTFQHLFFGYPMAALGAYIALTASDTTSAIAGVGLLISGTIVLITTPKGPQN